MEQITKKISIGAVLIILMSFCVMAGTLDFTDSADKEVTESKSAELIDKIISTSTAIDTGLEDSSGVELDWISGGINDRCLGIDVNLELKESVPFDLVIIGDNFDSRDISEVSLFKQTSTIKEIIEYDYSSYVKLSTELNGSTTRTYTITPTEVSRREVSVHDWVFAESGKAEYSAYESKISEQSISEDGYYMACFNLPYDSKGTEGMVYVLIDGKSYVDMQHSSWWNNDYSYKKTLTITNPSALELSEGYTINISVDTSALIDSGLMQQDCDDLRIVCGSTEMDRVFINETELGQKFYTASQGCDSSASSIFFRLDYNISASGNTQNCSVYYGNPSASSPPENESKVFWFAEDFRNCVGDITSLGWTMTGTGVTCDGDNASVAANNDDAYFNINPMPINTGYRFYTSLIYGGTSGDGSVAGFGKQGGTGDGFADDDAIISCLSSESSSLKIRRSVSGATKAVAYTVLSNQENTTVTHVYNRDVIDFKTYSNNYGSQLAYSTNDTIDPSTFDQTLRVVGISANRANDAIGFIYMTRMMDIEPTVTLGAQESSESGTLEISYPGNASYSYLLKPSAINYIFSNSSGIRDVCWYNKGTGTANSSTVAGGINFTILVSSVGSNRINLYCNMTKGSILFNTTSYFVQSPEALIIAPLNNSNLSLIGSAFSHFQFWIPSPAVCLIAYEEFSSNLSYPAGSNSKRLGFEETNRSITVYLNCTDNGVLFSNSTRFNYTYASETGQFLEAGECPSDSTQSVLMFGVIIAFIFGLIILNKLYIRIMVIDMIVALAVVFIGFVFLGCSAVIGAVALAFGLIYLTASIFMRV